MWTLTKICCNENDPKKSIKDICKEIIKKFTVLLEIALTDKGRLSGASLSEQMFEHISIISINFRTFF